MDRQFIIFMEYQDKIYNYSLIDKKELHKILCDIKYKYFYYLINVLAVDENNKPIGKTLKQYRYKHSRGHTISEPIYLEYFYYKYPELVQNYLVHIIDKDKFNKLYVRYFNYIEEAYEYMKNTFLEYLECRNRTDQFEFFDVDELYFDNCDTVVDYDYFINKNHTLAFGKIDKIYVNDTNMIYKQNKEKTKEEIITLFNNGFLSDNLTFIINEHYFDIKLINNNKTNKSCIICGDDNTKSYNKVCIELGKGELSWSMATTYNNNATFFYCEKHYPNMII
jgi:hypothetical protein